MKTIEEKLRVVVAQLRKEADMSDSYYADDLEKAITQTQRDVYGTIASIIESVLDNDSEEQDPRLGESVDILAARLTAHFTKAAAGAVADLHGQGLPAHGDVDGVWREVPPPEEA